MAQFNIYKTATGGQYYWTLEANNNEVVATSETYTSKSGAQNGIDAVKRVAPGAPIFDYTPYQ